jgi:hypothetical protein
MKTYNNNCWAYNFMSRTDKARFNTATISQNRQVYTKLRRKLQVPHGLLNIPQYEHLQAYGWWKLTKTVLCSREGIKL